MKGGIMQGKISSAGGGCAPRTSTYRFGFVLRLCRAFHSLLRISPRILIKLHGHVAQLALEFEIAAPSLPAQMATDTSRNGSDEENSLVECHLWSAADRGIHEQPRPG